MSDIQQKIDKILRKLKNGVDKNSEQQKAISDFKFSIYEIEKRSISDGMFVFLWLRGVFVTNL